MQKYPEAEEARAVMIEALEWSVMKWLREKKRVRKMADRANAALDAKVNAVKSRWNRDLLEAYESLDLPESKGGTSNTRAALLTTAKQVRQADEEALSARTSAEETFDEAEKQLSTRLAREGCRKAIASWDLFEKAIKLAETKLPTAKERT
jgi:hypothetical protein